MPERSVFFHVDLDAFFASVEQRDHPEYRGKPLIIGEVGPRMVVSTCSYEARRYGVHSAMPTLQAFRLCPNGIFIPGNMRLYSEVSRQVMSILHDYTPDIHQVSIDEARLDMTGTRLLFGAPKPLAVKIKDRVRSEVGITMSIGIAHSPFIAKMASDYNKPDGLCMVSAGKEQAFIDAIGLSKIWGLGKSSLKVLNSKMLYTPEQVRAVPLQRLEKMFGASMGGFLYKAVRGEDPGVFSSEVKSHSISTETTFIQDVTDIETLHQVLLGMCQELMYRSFDEGVIGRTAGLKLRWGDDFHAVTVQETPESGILNITQLYSSAKRLLASKWKDGRGVRLIGLGLYQTYKGDAPVQDSLFAEEDHRRRTLDKTVHRLGTQGYTLKKASELERHD